MSKLEELINRLCPDGVEYKTLGEVATISRGGNFQKKDFVEEGKPCIHYGQIYTKYDLFTDKTLTFINEECFSKQKQAVKNDIIMAVTSENIEDVCKCVAWLGDENVAVSGHSAIIHHSLDPKYLTYFFHSAHFFSQKRKLAHGTKVIEVTPDTLKSIKLPVPPLEVQREIVRVLDNFTFLTTELAAELAARQKQYEYYRDLLLTFKQDESTILNELELSDTVRWMKLGEVAEVSDYVANGSFASIKANVNYKRGSGYAMLIRTVDFSNGFDRNNAIYIDKQAYEFLNKSKLYGGEIIINNIGAGVGTVFRCPKMNMPMSLAPNAILVKTSNNEFYYYWLQSKHGQNAIKRIVSKSALPKFNKTEFRNILIPFPPLSEQRRIVSILDRFDTLCNDLTSGLPAEIALRQKQYEYYRDKLLTFKELKKEA